MPCNSARFIVDSKISMSVWGIGCKCPTAVSSFCSSEFIIKKTKQLKLRYRQCACVSYFTQQQQVNTRKRAHGSAHVVTAPHINVQGSRLFNSRTK